jgi:hypothetical protein
MGHTRKKVTLVSDLDALVAEMGAPPLLLVRPQWERRYPDQRMHTTVELTDLDTINLASTTFYETH